MVAVTSTLLIHLKYVFVLPRPKITRCKRYDTKSYLESSLYLFPYRYLLVGFSHRKAHLQPQYQESCTRIELEQRRVPSELDPS
jgi:hypothetical protein